MTPSIKEEPLAFMPSSNDALHTSRDLDGYPSPRSSVSNHKSESDFHKHQLLSHESVALSPSQSRSEEPMAFNVRSGVDLPLRAMISSASPLRQDVNNGVESKMQTNWQELYFDLRTHNDKVVQGLREHIEFLEAELRKSRIDSGTFQYPWAESNKPSFTTVHHPSRDMGQKTSFGNASSPSNGHINGASASLDKISTGDPPNGVSEQRRSSSTGNQSARAVSFGQLQSIPEDANAMRSNGGNMDTTHGSSVMGAKWHAEDPPSPPSTAMVSSPTHLRTHAGRTPPDPSMIEQRPTNDINGQRFSGTDGVDEDPALQEPRIICGAPELEALHQRLKQVESDPEMHPPQALQSESYMQSNNDTTSASDGPSAGDAVEGIVLKRKPSTNFGMAWGVARNGAAKRS